MEFNFDGSMSREVLENYLSRSITMAELLLGYGHAQDNIRMLENTGAKFVGRAIYMWGSEQKHAQNLVIGKQIADQIHNVDAQIILQAGIFEVVTTAVDDIPIPSWVFEAFGLEAETASAGRCFRYRDMVFADGLYVDHWGTGSSVPDITRLETKMWFLYLAGSYIQIGVEAIHFGQVVLIGRNDPQLHHWWEVLSNIRSFAKKQARRHFVLCDAHVSSGVGCYGLPDDASLCPGGFLVNTGGIADRLLLDFHALPLRIKEKPGCPQEAELQVGHLDSLYGRSIGGVTPSGWRCAHLPYLVEYDNYGYTGRGGESVTGKLGEFASGIDDRYWIWGWDEICWFSHQTEDYRNYWLRYAWDWVKEHDRNGFIEMPGMRGLADGVNGFNEYYANTRNAACPEGQSQEETIKAIWS